MRLSPIACAVLLVGSSAGAATSQTDRLEQLSRVIELQVIAWRRDIHQHPELSNREVRTAKLVAQHLKRLGLEVQTGLAHTAILMGVAQILTELRAELPGNVLFVFQPAEEGAPAGEEGGAALMLKEGLFDRHSPQAIFGLHVSSMLRVGEIGYRSGPMMAAADGYRILVRGRQSHGSRPWQSIDPVVTSAQIINALQTVVSRRVDITADPAVVTVGAVKGGIRNNIIPETVEMIGTIRTFTAAQRTRVLDEMRRIVAGTAAANGAAAEFTIDPGGYPVTVNDPALTQRIAPSLGSTLGVTQVRELSRITGAEDFSFYAQRVPGLFFFVGVTPVDQDPLQAPPNHSGSFYVDERGIGVGLRALARVAVDYLAGGSQH